MGLSIIILAAGEGTRMRSSQPKVLHSVGNKTLLQHVIDTAKHLDAEQIQVVCGHGGEQVRDSLTDSTLNWVEQAEQRGTGHAVAQALPEVSDNDRALILYGDVPLISEVTLRRLFDAAGTNALGLLTAELDDPSGYGRILRNDHHQVIGIVEEKDATDAQRSICEINTGFMATQARDLKRWVAGLDNRNAQGEYYLTDVIAAAVNEGVTVNTVSPDDLAEVLGVNDRQQLAQLERHFQLKQASTLMLNGVTLMDPARFDLRGYLKTGEDVSIDINVVLEGEVMLGDRVQIGPNCVIRNAHIEADVEVLANCVIEDAVIGKGSRIGPFARIRPETHLADHVHIGNFVEVKKSVINAGSKVNHLSYIGDTIIGSRVNIGAGTITCNYDGANKHQTIIEDDVFVGSDTQLVAPVKVGAGATIGAGTTLTKDAPAGELTFSRVPQAMRKGWKRPVKKTTQ